MKVKTKEDVRRRLHDRIRKKIHGTTTRPRLKSRPARPDPSLVDCNNHS